MNMKLKKGLKFIQDNTIHCEVIDIFQQRKIDKIKILKNDKIVIYDLICFQKSFSLSLELKTKSFKLI